MSFTFRYSFHLPYREAWNAWIFVSVFRGPLEASNLKKDNFQITIGVGSIPVDFDHNVLSLRPALSL